MKFKFYLIVLFLGFALNTHCQEIKTYSINELKKQAEMLQGKKVEVIGLVAHICGSDGKKLKLKSPSGAVLKIVSRDTTKRFDSSLKKQLVRVLGVVEVKYIQKSYVDKMEEQGTLLCHIDHKACNDKQWVNNKIETGKDVEIVKKDIAKLRKTMADSGKDYISVVSLRSELLEIFE